MEVPAAGSRLAFGNVSELDILFGMEKAYTVLDELFIAGELCEPSLKRTMYYLGEIDSWLADEMLRENLGLDLDEDKPRRRQMTR
ncbi:hypothetical protein HDU91_004890 [Kappamyces sp. JEL0680]|nr:hypothetical protein HDU91_004890 [Kappamyces sp. JEL0680]